MIKQPKETEDTTISFETLDGVRFDKRDIPQTPISEDSKLVSFWDDENTLMIIPMDRMKWVILHF